MKLTKRQLRKIIREEKARLLQEAFPGGWDGSYGGSVREGSDVMELVSEQLAELGVEALSNWVQCVDLPLAVIRMFSHVRIRR